VLGALNVHVFKLSASTCRRYHVKETAHDLFRHALHGFCRMVTANWSSSVLFHLSPIPNGARDIPRWFGGRIIGVEA